MHLKRIVHLTSQPRGRRFKIATAVAALMIAGLAWWSTFESPMVERARGLGIGQTMTEVDAIMRAGADLRGGDNYGNQVRLYATAGESRSFQIRRLLMSWLGRTGLPDQFLEFEYPVEVHFQDGRVVYLRRGKERMTKGITPGLRSPR